MKQTKEPKISYEVRLSQKTGKKITLLPAKQKQEHTFRGNVAASFRGGAAVRKVLLRAGMQVAKVEMYHGALGSIWEADVLKNGQAQKRWVQHDNSGWKILKAPPLAAQGPGCRFARL